VTESRSYRVELTPAARRQLRKLDKPVQRRIFAQLDVLEADPRLPGCRAMVGQKKRWRVRVSGAGDYRIVYQIEDTELLVLVVTVAHRREAYR